MKQVIKGLGGRPFTGRFTPPPDKSITHRAFMLAALAAGESEVINPSSGLDCRSTLACVEALGARARWEGPERVIITGTAGHPTEPVDILDAGNSGTTTRLLSGVLAGQPFFSILTGDASLRSRPMGRVTKPLRQMGATISGRGGGDLAPLAINGTRLRPIDYALPVASAQVKSCLILAGLAADGETVITEPLATRDHTERMLVKAGARLHVAAGAPSPAAAAPAAPPSRGRQVRVPGPQILRPFSVRIPGDISSAAFFLALAAAIPGARLTVEEVGLNPLRDGFQRSLVKAGIPLETRAAPATGAGDAYGNDAYGDEPWGDITLTGPQSFRGLNLEAEDIPDLVDEVPILAVLATQASEPSLIRGAAELRVKESDRLAGIAGQLAAMGARIEERPDGLYIEPSRLRGAQVRTYGDHRLAMSLAVAALLAEGETSIEDFECAAVSFPGFGEELARLTSGGSTEGNEAGGHDGARPKDGGAR